MEQVKHIKRFQQYLDNWEATVGKLGFLSQATAEGFRVTLASTLSLLTYVTKTLGFKYLMTARLSQDSIENLFGILRQMSGCNDHPTPTQFLISVNCLSFYSLARSPTSGNILQGLLNSLLDPRSNSDPAKLQNKLADLLDADYLNEAHEMIKACSALPEHGDTVALKSDSRITYYVSGYAARKMLKKTKCEECSRLLLQPKDSPSLPGESCLTKYMDRGGLLYPSQALKDLVEIMEDGITYCFTFNKLRANS
ncbi:hypothetical protein ISCGN_005854, partial [Ixodes scapularis]